MIATPVETTGPQVKGNTRFAFPGAGETQR